MAINLLQRLHEQLLLQFYNFIFALKISSDEESFIAMGIFFYNSLARNAIAPTPKRTDPGFSEPSKRILQML